VPSSHERMMHHLRSGVAALERHRANVASNVTVHLEESAKIGAPAPESEVVPDGHHED
jgi:hypothetical protein